MGGSPSIPTPERDPELDRRLAEQQAENERLKQEEADREQREKDARLRSLRGSSALFSNRFTGFPDDDDRQDTLGAGTV